MSRKKKRKEQKSYGPPYDRWHKFKKEKKGLKDNEFRNNATKAG